MNSYNPRWTGMAVDDLSRNDNLNILPLPSFGRFFG